MKHATKHAARRTATPVEPATPTADHERVDLHRALRAQLATVTGGLAPDDYVNAWWDWYLNLTRDPPRQQQIVEDALARLFDTWSFMLRAATGAKLSPDDGRTPGRFGHDAWAQWPFNVYARSYANTFDWLHKTCAQVPGMAPEHARSLDFATRSALEALSPANYLPTNPELIAATRDEAGANLVRGFRHWLEDIGKAVDGKGKAGSTDFVVGRDVAATPGKVVLRNELAELIQYSPATPQVYAEPILIIPAWIMKYYILDLSAQNSLVRYLVGQGHTVFIVSWKNPDAGDRGLGIDDYLKLGVRDMVDAVSRILPQRQIHTVGYCIGGTLLSIAAADYAADGDRRLASMTLLAAQQDFSEPGELSVFITPGQLDMLEAVMQRAGVLKSEQMAGAFTLLRSRDLLWTPAVNTYLRGRREPVNDLMAWNADGTRMPCRMHSEYLRGLYLDNALANGEFRCRGRRVDLSGIRLPMFVVGTETDHVAPWQSVYKARGLTRSVDYTFLLTSGGHNAGIISGPVHPRRRHRIRTWLNDNEAPPAQSWFDSTPPQPGSWWPAWQHWLAQHSTPALVDPPPLGSTTAGCPVIGDAPGEYVLQK